MATFQSGGLDLAYDDIRPAGGEQGTVLLVHGFATSRAENWRRLGWYAAFERKGWRVIAFDHRGHGESAKPHDPQAYDRDAMVSDIFALMDHLDLGRADLLGYSMGAHLSLRAALNEPTRVGKLVLGGVGGRMLNPTPPKPGAMSMAQAMLAPDAAAITEPTLKGFRLFAEQQGEDLAALAACSQGQSEPVGPAELFGLQPQTLVVAGARDELAGDPQDLADAIPGAKAVLLPGCDHFNAIPHALFKAAVFDFLEGYDEDDFPPFE
ncbi:alpha/beta fold hydrolase [Caulobacter sp. KR2-114]|uniref:alpha/beta fold hydrolase n=1 Tax=Caulobacter sp. KR2-114 TaxID=3400912 RepID=UPI003C0BA71E